MTQAPLTLDHPTGDIREMSAVELAALGGTSGAPLVVPDDTTLTVQADQSLLFRSEIVVKGEINIKGELVQV